MQSTFSIGEHVVYSVYGVCLIDDICKKSYGKDELCDFYVLKPVFDKASTYFVPVDSEATKRKLRLPLSKEKIDEIIAQSALHPIVWESDRKLRMEAFNSIIKACDPQELLSLIACIYRQEIALLNLSKRLSSYDELTLKRAEKIIENEFCFILSIEPSQVGKYIKDRV